MVRTPTESKYKDFPEFALVPFAPSVSRHPGAYSFGLIGDFYFPPFILLSWSLGKKTKFCVASNFKQFWTGNMKRVHYIQHATFWNRNQATNYNIYKYKITSTLFSVSIKDFTLGLPVSMGLPNKTFSSFPKQIQVFIFLVHKEIFCSPTNQFCQKFSRKIDNTVPFHQQLFTSILHTKSTGARHLFLNNNHTFAVSNSNRNRSNFT